MKEKLLKLSKPLLLGWYGFGRLGIDGEGVSIALFLVNMNIQKQLKVLDA